MHDFDCPVISLCVILVSYTHTGFVNNKNIDIDDERIGSLFVIQKQAKKWAGMAIEILARENFASMRVSEHFDRWKKMSNKICRIRCFSRLAWKKASIRSFVILSDIVRFRVALSLKIARHDRDRWVFVGLGPQYPAWRGG